MIGYINIVCVMIVERAYRTSLIQLTLKMKASTVLHIVLILSAVGISSKVEACSCPLNSNRGRSASLRDGICRGDVYVAKVSGAVCSCVSDNTGDENGTVYNCQDYQSQAGAVLNVNLTSRGRCERQQPVYLFEAVHNCSILTQRFAAGQGYSVEGPSDDNLPLVQNLTHPNDYCYLSCPFNVPTEFPNSAQPCMYKLTITEVIKGNYTAGDTMLNPGPDVLTTCGNPQALLTINEQYVVGVGSLCESISAWTPLQSYSSSELQQLRDFSARFQTGSLTCGALGHVPSFVIIIALVTFVTTTTFFY